MNLLRDKEAREEIETLKQKLAELISKLTYTDWDTCHKLYNFGLFPPSEQLTAQKIQEQFKEIYEFLGVKRTTTEKSSSTKLEKKPTQRKAKK